MLESGDLGVECCQYLLRVHVANIANRQTNCCLPRHDHPADLGRVVFGRTTSGQIGILSH
jgi:hypothetical protein